tara:strand:+ start:285 stop:689 length:405 start_codon:yes stop_codon:yes gene_type:complete
MREFYKGKTVACHSMREVYLTDEELAMDITTDRLFEEYEDNIFEDTGFINDKVFAGFVLAKHPELSEFILDIINDKYFEYMNFSEIFDDDDGYGGYEKLAELFCEFVNLTKRSKERVNIFLISILNHYYPTEGE